MYDKLIIVDGSLQTVGNGFSVGLRIPYYRGLGLSMVEIPELRIDGVAVDLSDAEFNVHGARYRLADLPTIIDDRWGFTQMATLIVPGTSIESGPHEVVVTISLRVSYMPVPSVATFSKSLVVAS